MADPPPLYRRRDKTPTTSLLSLQPALPPTQPLVDDGATAAEIAAMPALGLGLTFDAATAAIGHRAE